MRKILFSLAIALLVFPCGALAQYPTHCGTDGYRIEWDSASGQFKCSAPVAALTIQTNGTANGSQSLLNLKDGSNITITDDGSGGVTIASSGGSGTGAPAMNEIYVTTTSCADVPAGVSCYVANGDGSTDNSTVFGNVATAANSYSQGTVNSQNVTPLTVVFATGVYAYASGLAFTQPVTIKCEPGTMLKYTGTGHALELGPTGLTSSTLDTGPYAVEGCGFEDGSTMTAGIYVNAYVPNVTISGLYLRNFGPSSTSVWQLHFAGGNYHQMVFNNWVVNDDNSVRNFDLMGTATNGGYTIFRGNTLINWSDATGGACASASGIGVEVTYSGADIGNNVFSCGWSPAIVLANGLIGVSIHDIYAESDTTSTDTGFMILGTGAGGTEKGISVRNVHYVSHNNGYFIDRAGSSSAISNMHLENIDLLNYPSQKAVVNQYSGTSQLGNVATNITSTTGATSPTIEYYIHSIGYQIPGWNRPDNKSWTDAFTRANGSVTLPWQILQPTETLLSISSNTATCSTGSCSNLWGLDVGQDQEATIGISTAPTGTDFVAVWARATVTTASNNLYGYTCQDINGTGVQLVRKNATSSTTLAGPETSTVPASGDTLSISVTGEGVLDSYNVVTCSVNGTAVLRARDSTFNSGYTGATVGGTSGALSFFKARSLQ